MATSGKMELIIKINEMPQDVKIVKDGWKEFVLDVGNQKEILITVRPKMFKKLEDAQQQFPQWVASISGKMGAPTSSGFILEEPSIQVFEKKPKAPKDSSDDQNTPS